MPSDKKDRANGLFWKPARAFFESENFAEVDRDADAFQLNQRQRSYFLVWRQDKKAAFKTQPKEARRTFRQCRGEILSRFSRDAAIEAAPTAPAIAYKVPSPIPANRP
ncbi:MAG: hypothetical protein HGA90_06010 [Alphaproteobacteria bacterium]|nr:hypothetical protein [Alphaproteobacteria bacterium]